MFESHPLLKFLLSSHPGRWTRHPLRVDLKARFPQGGGLGRLSRDFAAHRGTQKAGEVREDFFQHVGVMNMATNVRIVVQLSLTGTKGWKTQCQGQG